MPELLIASENPGKMIEIQDLLSNLNVTLIAPSTLGLHLNVVEDGHTYAENAARKALAYARASGRTSLGDDSGLEVEALGGKPGLYSHRFAPWPNATDADRRAYLLDQLRGVPHPAHLPGWPARFRCTVAIATPSGDLRYADGECSGVIISEERGDQGFGYDPVFFIPDYGKTMAELGMDVKNQISHRARAVRASLPLLAELLGNP